MTTQTLERALDLMRILAASGTDGCRLVDLQRASGLTKPTVHRILDTLKIQGVVEQQEDTRRYRLGQELAVLGWSANRTVYDLKELAAEEMCAVASRTGDTSFLALRSGTEAVCIDRQTGDYPVKAFTVDVGTRRPLGIGATGVALLAALDPAEADAAMDAIRPQLPRYPNASLRQIREAVASARRHGYAVSEGLMLKEVRGVAVVIRDGRERAIAAIGIAAISDRVSNRRLPEIVRLLRTHANHIEQRIATAESRATGNPVRHYRAGTTIAARTRRSA
ncbi:IclR family transcriptional regulator [Ramlibacter sp. AW1]|uniref:IclR family transcriptional regulator n=1 Tax=Ramlibacter aurantiacus TaxID=2801330 RepID=A0A937D3I6_9BURK|nr:IclR family transcriptional regulator [Ramlibacter aurantiacus]MBL0422704.1 IclR family transcriptional regulator [Ramlibacter aurantiacus]